MIPIKIPTQEKMSDDPFYLAEGDDYGKLGFKVLMFQNKVNSENKRACTARKILDLKSFQIK